MLEEQWQGPGSVLGQDWGSAERRRTTTGRADLEASRVSDEGEGEGEELALLARPVRKVGGMREGGNTRVVLKGMHVLRTIGWA